MATKVFQILFKFILIDKWLEIKRKKSLAKKSYEIELEWIAIIKY